MSVLKRIEMIAKLLLAVVASVLLWRPGRRGAARARLESRRRVLVVRIDDRVGEALLTTPLLTALRRMKPAPEVHALVHRGAARALEGHPDADRILPFDRRWLWLGAAAPGIRALREAGFDVVVNAANWEVPSVTAAIVSRLAGPRAAVVGPSVWPSGLLADVPVAPRPDTRSEVLQRLHLLEPLGLEGPPPPLSFRTPRPEPGVGALLDAVRATPHAILNPGGRLDWRRVPPEAFAAAARVLLLEGRTPLVTWGPGEEALAQEVAAAAPGAVLAPRTSLDALAALMGAAGLTVCNNTGPMHLSVAVGAPTLALFMKMDSARWGHAALPNRVIDLTCLAGDAEALCARVEEEVAAFARALPQRSGRASSTSITGMSSLMS